MMFNESISTSETSDKEHGSSRPSISLELFGLDERNGAKHVVKNTNNFVTHQKENHKTTISETFNFNFLLL